MGFCVVIVRSKSAQGAQGPAYMATHALSWLAPSWLGFDARYVAHRIYWELVWTIQEDQVLDEPHHIDSLTSTFPLRAMSTRTEERSFTCTHIAIYIFKNEGIHGIKPNMRRY